MEVIIENDYRKRKAEVFLSVKEGNKTFLLGYDGKHIVKQVLPDYGSIENEIIPFFSIPLQYKEDILKAFAKAASDNNIGTEQENLLKGKLEATQLHLNDMREFAKHVIIK